MSSANNMTNDDAWHQDRMKYLVWWEEQWWIIMQRQWMTCTKPGTCTKPRTCPKPKVEVQSLNDDAKQSLKPRTTGWGAIFERWHETKFEEAGKTKTQASKPYPRIQKGSNGLSPKTVPFKRGQLAARQPRQLKSNAEIRRKSKWIEPNCEKPSTTLRSLLLRLFQSTS